MNIDTAKSIAKDIPVMYNPSTTGLIHGETLDFIGMVSATDEELAYFYKPITIEGGDYLVPHAHINHIEDYHSWFSKKAERIICTLAFNYHSDYATIHDALMAETTAFNVELDKDWRILRLTDDYDINYRLAPTIGLDARHHVSLKWALRRYTREKMNKKDALRAVLYPSIEAALTDLFEKENYSIASQGTTLKKASKGKVLPKAPSRLEEEDDDDDY